jgi:hypothetical protein
VRSTGSSAPPSALRELGREEVAKFAAHVTDWELDRYRDLD